MVFRVLVFGDLNQDPDKLRELLEEIREWRNGTQPWDVIIPKCNAMIQKTDFRQLDAEQRQEFLVRCSVSLDMECLGHEPIDLIVGFRQGATFVVASMALIELRSTRYLLIGGDPTFVASPDDGLVGMTLVRNDTTILPGTRVVFANHPSDLILACPRRELERLERKYREDREALVHGMLKDRFLGYTQLTRREVENLLDDHQALILGHEADKLRHRRKVAPLGHYFVSSMVVAELVSDSLDVIDDPKIIAIVAGMVRS